MSDRAEPRDVEEPSVDKSFLKTCAIMGAAGLDTGTTAVPTFNSKGKFSNYETRAHDPEENCFIVIARGDGAPTRRRNWKWAAAFAVVLLLNVVLVALLASRGRDSGDAVAQPMAAQPVEAQPEVAQPEEDQPAAADAQPETSEVNSAAAQLADTQPADAQPEESQPEEHHKKHQHTGDGHMHKEHHKDKEHHHSHPREHGPLIIAASDFSSVQRPDGPAVQGDPRILLIKFDLTSIYGNDDSRRNHRHHPVGVASAKLGLFLRAHNQYSGPVEVYVDAIPGQVDMERDLTAWDEEPSKFHVGSFSATGSDEGEKSEGERYEIDVTHAINTEDDWITFGLTVGSYSRLHFAGGHLDEVGTAPELEVSPFTLHL